MNNRSESTYRAWRWRYVLLPIAMFAFVYAAYMDRIDLMVCAGIYIVIEMFEPSPTAVAERAMSERILQRERIVNHKLGRTN